MTNQQQAAMIFGEEKAQPTTGAGIAIAAIWISVCSFLYLLAKLLIDTFQTKEDTHVSILSVARPNADPVLAGMGYFFLTLILGCLACWATYIVRTGRS
jgi:hypothetical protein